MNYTGGDGSHPKSPKRDKLYTRWGQLRSERASFWAHWQEITTYLLPYNGRYFTQDRNKGHRRYNNIYDSTGTRSLRVLGAGLMAGATSPARPWFRLQTPDHALNRYQPVRIWLDDCARIMQTVFQRSNTYRVLHTMYEELGAFGTASSIILPDYNRVIHHYPVTVGEFCIATDYQGQVTTFYREFEKTVAELVREFGYDNCSKAVQTQWDRGNLDNWVTLIHSIEPRSDRDPKMRDALNMAWRSCYFESGADPEKYLRESGFEDFPVLVPRWSTAGGDIYGHSPGMEALGAIKQLQHQQLRKAQCIDYQTKPPLQVPVSMKNRDVDTLPGGINYVDVSGPNMGIRSAFEVQLNLQHLLPDMEETRDRIKSSFYADLFLMLATQPISRMTATEIVERHEEKLLMIGPVIERLHNELLEPLIDRTFQYLVKANAIPPAPPELQGMELSIEFVSILAQAQRAIGVNSVDRFVGNLGVIAQMKPDVLDKLDADQWVDAYADMLGVDPRIIIGGREVAMIREARNQAQQAEAQLAAQAQQAETAQRLSAADTGGKNALTDMMNMFSGYGSPSAAEV